MIEDQAATGAFRLRTHIRSSSWWWLVGGLTLTLGVAFAIWLYGQLNPEYSITITGWFALLAFLTGLYHAGVKVSTYRGDAWRLISKTTWLYEQLIRQNWAWLLLVSLPPLLLTLGADGAQSSVWTIMAIKAVAVALGLAGSFWLGAAGYLLVRVASRNRLVRVILLLLIFWAISFVITPGQNWLRQALIVTSTNQAIYLLLFGLGLSGTALIASELAIVHLSIAERPRRQYFQLKLPSRALGGFGEGTATFCTQIIRFLRDSATERQFLSAIGWLLLGLAAVNALTNTYQIQAQTLFWLISLMVVGLLVGNFGRLAGKKLENWLTSHHFLPRQLNKTRLAYLAAAFVIAAFATTILIELFATGVTGVGQLWLIILVAGVSLLVAFGIGQLEERLSEWQPDPIRGYLATTVVASFVLVCSTIAWLFSDVANTLTASWLIGLWTLGAWLIISLVGRWKLGWRER